MSIPTTNYEISTGQDLNLIFAPLVGTAGSDSGFEYYDTTSLTYKDLSTLFLPYTNDPVSATNYVSDLAPHNGKDLNIIFQNISIPPTPPYTVTVISGTWSPVIVGNLYTLTFNVGSFTINFSQNLAISISVIGGGGGGGGGSETKPVSGGGGGSGGLGTLSMSSGTITTYNIAVGAGGAPGGGNIQGGPGGTSSFGTTLISSTGGGGGNGNYFGGGGGPEGVSSGTGVINYSGGKGGDSYPNAATGNGTSAVSPIIIGGYSVGGGGGGGSNGLGGQAALNGVGGAYGGNTVLPGQTATSYGSGAGGGSYYSSSPQAGGTGAPGVIVITFTYP